MKESRCIKIMYKEYAKKINSRIENLNIDIYLKHIIKKTRKLKKYARIVDCLVCLIK